jgi:hypothetical protein
MSLAVLPTNFYQFLKLYEGWLHKILWLATVCIVKSLVIISKTLATIGRTLVKHQSPSKTLVTSVTLSNHRLLFAATHRLDIPPSRYLTVRFSDNHQLPIALGNQWQHWHWLILYLYQSVSAVINFFYYRISQAYGKLYFIPCKRSKEV